MRYVIKDYYNMSNIFQVLPKLQNLEVINYGDCLVRTEGAIAITEALKEGYQKLKVIVHITHKFSSLKDNRCLLF